MRTLEEIKADFKNASNNRNADQLRSILDELDVLSTAEAEALSACVLGDLHLLNDDFRGALEEFERSLSIYQKLGDLASAAFMTVGIANVYGRIGDYSKALDQYGRGLLMAEEVGDHSLIATVTGNMGNLFYSTGDYPAALERYERALTLHERGGFRSSMASVISNIGMLYTATRDFQQALEYDQRALSLYEELGDRHGAANVMSSVGIAYGENGDHIRALEKFEESLAIFEELGDRTGATVVACNVLRSLIFLGEEERAERLLASFNEAEIPQPFIRTSMLSARALLHERQGDLDAAHATLLEALKVSDEAGLRSDSAEFHQSLRDLAQKRNDFEGYIKHNSEYQRITEDIRGKDATQKMAMMEAQRGIEAERLERDKERALLYGALPESVAKRMLLGEAVEDHFESAAVLFTDVVGFTTNSSDMHPHEVIKLLENLYKDFDAICAEHGVVKVKTIGDSYLCFKGDGTAEENAAAVASVALSMQKNSTAWPSGEPLTHRIGIHSGPVSAGVIGTQRLQYDIWGDTVNVASRMESSCEPGRIQVSANFASALSSPLSALRYRGATEVKGKGAIETYWLEPV